MIFGTPQSPRDVFTDFGIGVGEQPVTITPNPNPEENSIQQVDTEGETLRQLTTRPVAGFVTFTASSGPIIRYAEVGTGHVYEIDVNSGAEIRISGTTIPRVTEAVFSKNGQYVALTSITRYVTDVFVGELTTTDEGVGSIEGMNLPPNAREVYLEDQLVQYLLPSTEGSTGYVYDLESNEQKQLFTLPFTSVQAIWTDDATFVYNQYAPTLEGSLFQVNSNNLTPVLPAAYGFLALVNDSYFVSTVNNSGEMQSFAENRNSEIRNELAVVPIPEKCDFDKKFEDILWCAAPLEEPLPASIKNWYQGGTANQDFIWEVSLASTAALIHDDLSALAGRTIDVADLDKLEDALYFINKIDSTLWMYDLAI